MSGLYIHIPFCHAKCAYCDFFSTPQQTDVDGYIQAIHREYNRRKNEIATPSFKTIYIGGGTPSILTPRQLAALLQPFDLSESIETTIEVNPEDVTPDFAAAILNIGINRVSMGVQSLCDSELRAIGRRHSAADALRAIDTLRHAGVSNLSLDLIFGLPGQSLERWENTLQQTLAVQPEHLSAYSLMYEPGTRLWAQLQSGKITETPQDVSAQMYDRLCEATRENGLQHYEISNFSKPGFHSRHNSSYWNLTPYLGLGVSAHSFNGHTRSYNPPNIRGYIAANNSVAIEENLTESERINEYLLIRLRTAQGLSLTDFCNRFGSDALKRLQNRATHQPLLEQTDNTISIPEKSWLVSDSILVELFE